MAKKKIGKKMAKSQVVIIRPKKIDINPPKIVEIRKLLAMLRKDLL